MPLAADVHTIAIPLHALSATGAFIFGAFLIFQDRDTHRQLRLGEALVISLLLMEGFLVTAVLSNPAGLPIITLAIFGGLPILGVYMIFRAVQALSVLRGQKGNQLAVIDHAGFVLISLFDGFAIISAFDLGAPGWLLAVIAVSAVVVGIYAINVRKRSVTARSGGEGTGGIVQAGGS
jgi:hypothetical protein